MWTCYLIQYCMQSHEAPDSAYERTHPSVSSAAHCLYKISNLSWSKRACDLYFTSYFRCQTLASAAKTDAGWAISSRRGAHKSALCGQYPVSLSIYLSSLTVSLTLTNRHCQQYAGSGQAFQTLAFLDCILLLTLAPKG